MGTLNLCNTTKETTATTRANTSRPPRRSLGKQDLRGEEGRQVRYDADHRRRDPYEDRAKPTVVGQELYIRGQHEDEQEAGQERGVGRHGGPERPVEER